MTAIPFADLPSVAPDGCRTVDRRDPYWTGLWHAGSTALWLSEAEVRRHHDLAGTKPPPGFREPRDAALKRARRQYAFRRLPTLGAVHSWRTATDEQVAALTGNETLRPARSKDVATLWSAGLIEVGALPAHPGLPRPQRLLRAAPRAPIDAFLRYLPPDERTRLLGDAVWSWSGCDRHNVLTTEFGLRVAEFVPGIAAIAGEAHATLTGLAARPPLVDPETGEERQRRRRRGPSARRGDAVLVRDDGLRVVVETTATVSGSLRGKIAAWADALADDPTLVVLFLEAPHPDKVTASNRRVLEYLRETVRGAATGVLPRTLAQVYKRMLVVSWAEWFPEPGLVVSDFAALPAWRLTGQRPTDGWERVSLMDRAAFASDEVGERYLASVRDLYGNAVWLRNPSGAGDDADGDWAWDDARDGREPVDDPFAEDPFLEDDVDPDDPFGLDAEASSATAVPTPERLREIDLLLQDPFLTDAERAALLAERDGDDPSDRWWE